MFSIKKQIFFLLFFCTLLTATIIGGYSGFLSLRLSRENAEAKMALQCEQLASELNTTLLQVRLAVESGYRQIIDEGLYSPELLENEERLRQFTASIEKNIVSQAQYAQNCVAVYVRYDPSLPVEGFFYTRETGEELKKQPLTPLEKYSASDIEHVGWYYEPIRAGRAIWTVPYNNKNTDTRVVSYVIPINYRDKTVGVIGMDIDIRELGRHVLDQQFLDHGYAFVSYEDKVVIHNTIPFNTSMRGTEELANLVAMLERPENESDATGEYTFRGVQKRYVQKKLESGMTLFLCAPISELYTERGSWMIQFIVVVFSAVCIIMLLMFGLLLKFLRIATTDALTNLANREQFSVYFENSQNERMEYVFFLLDVDKFKTVNDTYGHEQGDKVLRTVASALERIRAGGMVARWGGDEFVGLIPAADAGDRLKALCEHISSVDDPVSGHISVSIGACPVDRITTLNHLVEAADEGMYQSKKVSGCHITWIKLGEKG